MNVINEVGALPTRNHQDVQFEGAKDISAEAMATPRKTDGKKQLVTNQACFGCTIACGRISKMDEGHFTVANKPQYWGASGGLGSYATQFALNGGAIPVCVVSSPEKAEIVRSLGAEHVIDRSAEGYKFWKDENTQDPKEWQRLGKQIRALTGGDDVDIVFEHPGRETFGASVYVAKKGGTIVTCASTSGYMHEYDNRYLWMNLKRIIGSHFANYREAYEANRLIAKGMIFPTVSKTFPLEQAGQAAFEVHRNAHQGKVGVLCLSPEEGLGVTNQQMRDELLPQINRFRNV
jgi:crotonyl-CoA reductase